MILKKVSTLEIPKLPTFSGAQFETTGFYLWLNFKNMFLTKKEPKSPGGTFKVSELTEYSLDNPILEELGDSAEVSLGELYEFLKTADKEYTYISYIKDQQNMLWEVSCYWHSDDWHSDDWCWNVAAYAIAHPSGWDAGSRVFSHDSSNPLISDKSLTLSPFDSEITLNGEIYVKKDKMLMDEDLRNELITIRAEHLAVANKISGVLRKLTNEK